MSGDECKKGAESFSLSDYNISYQTGFAMEDPLEFLPPYFEPWNSLAKRIPELLERHTFREEVKQLPVLDHKRLDGYREQRLAHLQLSLMTAAYVWQELPGVPESLPACLAVPYWGVSQDVGLPPNITYNSLLLANWKKKDLNGGLEVENFQTLYHFSRDSNAENFITLFVRVEMQFSEGVQGIEEGVRSIASRNDKGLIRGLGKIKSAIETMQALFRRVHGLVTPEAFMGKCVPFFQGFGHENSPIKDGLIFEGVSDLPIKTDHSSGAQTPSIQAVDAFMGLKTHQASEDMKHTMRVGMPPLHVRFLETLERLPSAREYVKRSTNEDLKIAFDDCLATLVNFRSYHIQAVTKYTVLAGRKLRKQMGIIPPTPPGGAYPIPLLKQIRNEIGEQNSRSRRL